MCVCVCNPGHRVCDCVCVCVTLGRVCVCYPGQSVCVLPWADWVCLHWAECVLKVICLQGIIIIILTHGIDQYRSELLWTCIPHFYTCIIAAYQESARKHVISFHDVFSFITVRTCVVFKYN